MRLKQGLDSVYGNRDKKRLVFLNLVSAYAEIGGRRARRSQKITGRHISKESSDDKT
jgi:hypothetical protein